MPSPFGPNTVAINRDRKHRKFLDTGNNEVDKEKNAITCQLSFRALNLILKSLPPIVNHLEKFFNPNDVEDIETMADLEELYQELIEIKREFQKNKGF